jgi:hypothetical protein
LILSHIVKAVPESEVYTMHIIGNSMLHIIKKYLERKSMALTTFSLFLLSKMITADATVITIILDCESVNRKNKKFTAHNPTTFFQLSFSKLQYIYSKVVHATSIDAILA